MGNWLEEKVLFIKCVCRNLPLPLKNKKNTWIRINISFLCSFVLHTVRTHHVLISVQMVE